MRHYEGHLERSSVGSYCDDQASDRGSLKAVVVVVVIVEVIVVM